MKTRTAVLLAGLMFGWSCVRAEEENAGPPPPPFQDISGAQAAWRTYSLAKDKATVVLDTALDKARKEYLPILKKELAEQTKKNKTEMMAEIEAAIKKLEEENAAYKKKLADALAAAALFKETSIYLPAGMKMFFILLPAGTFTMGSPKINDAPPHKVTLSKPFYMGKFLVTQEQWQAVMGGNPSYFKDPKNPVENFTWNECQDFISKVNQKLTGMKVALPTEAQWEFACRSGTKTEFFCGDDEHLLGDYGWCGANSGGKTHPVGMKKANPWGLFDMFGNTYEWLADWYGAYADGPVVDPAGPETGTQRVVRGGSWFEESTQAGNPHTVLNIVYHSAFRGCNEPAFKNSSHGCRLVLIMDEPKKP
jgi:formylglycine-generating enzyme required for sulfatase activity